MKKSAVLFSALMTFGTTVIAQNNNMKNVKQLTFSGDNAEAYFSPDGRYLTMQVTDPENGTPCDQIYMLDLSNPNPTKKDLKLISTGLGRTTCSFFMPDGKHILYASTHGEDKACPPAPAPIKGKYIWPIFPEFDIYVADLNGKIVKQLTNSPGYDAEAVLSPDGKKIAFTSLRTGDLEIWTMNIDGTNLKQITSGLGYDGGAFFSHGSKKLVFRSSRPNTPADIQEYKDLLSKGMVMPTNMEIYTVNVDGSNLKQLTHLGKANWSPYFLPDDSRIIFSSNHQSSHGFDFQLFTIDTNGRDLRQVTYESYFNAFPMFSPDGKKIAFSSNRNQDKPKETDVFIADWIPTDKAEIVSDVNLKSYVEFLASDKLEGRLTGSKGEEMAGDFIAKKLKEFGLKPYEGKDYFQKFTYDVLLDPHQSEKKVPGHGRNVIGFLDNHAKKTIVIGAHYDHLGKNEHHHSTLMNSEGQIHNGADDNASGSAALLELARMFSENIRTEPVNYIFAFFSGEEDGLIGSKHMAETLKNKYPNVVAMINMDMVGRLKEKRNMVVGGVGTSPIFSELIQRQKPAGFSVTEDSSGVGPSDHTSFYLKDIPVLFFFTGEHQDYHKPSDDADKINYYGLRFVTDYVFRVADELSTKDNIPFTKTKVESGKKIAKYKVTLGIMPDYAKEGNGLIIDGVIDGRPGAIAGVKSGDILTKIGTCEVKEVYSYMDCLSKFNSGESTDLEIIRDGKKVNLKVTF